MDKGRVIGSCGIEVGDIDASTIKSTPVPDSRLHSGPDVQNTLAC